MSSMRPNINLVLFISSTMKFWTCQLESLPPIDQRIVVDTDAVSTLVQLRFNLWEVSQLLNDTQHWQQHIDSAPRWCFKVEQLQEYGFGFQKTIQLLDMTLERSISVTEVWQFHFMQEMI
ncbi:Hypothetical_protein [Hexamita inflata]|uniref:Hypothetical_protein n=1 Tax=Hexamita inflata TaxID=28002 RepID=A0ABP1HFD9_9EUKA